RGRHQRRRSDDRRQQIEAVASDHQGNCTHPTEQEGSPLMMYSRRNAKPKKRERERENQRHHIHCHCNACAAPEKSCILAGCNVESGRFFPWHGSRVSLKRPMKARFAFLSALLIGCASGGGASSHPVHEAPAPPAGEAGGEAVSAGGGGDEHQPEVVHTGKKL